MAQFTQIQDVQKAFKSRANGGDTVKRHSGVRYSDLEKYAPVIERLLDTDYNKVSGFTFSEIMEAVSSVVTNYGSEYYASECRKNQGSSVVSESVANSDYWQAMNEAFEGTTVAQSPYPVPALSLTTYQYERAVIPFLAHQFDLQGNRGLIYYQNITATNSKGNVVAGNLLGSPKEIGVQPLDFVGTRTIPSEVLKALTSGTTSYTGTFANFPVEPGSVTVTVDGAEGYFKDIATVSDMKGGAISLLSVGGNLGTMTLNYVTGAYVITLATAPTGSGLSIRATYDREIQTVTGGAENMATVTMKLESKQLDAENFSVKTETNIYQEALSRAIFGLDWNTEVDQALGALYNKEVANKIITEVKNAIIPSSVSTHDISASIVGGGNNALFNTQFIAVVLGKLRKLIVAASGLGCNKLAAIAINIDVLPIMDALPKFKATDNNYEEVMGGMALVGLYDGIPVIVGYAPILAEGEVVGIYKSKTKDFLTPYVWGTFVLPIIRDVFDKDNLVVNQKQLIASAAGKVVAERLASKITITNINTII